MRADIALVSKVKNIISMRNMQEEQKRLTKILRFSYIILIKNFIGGYKNA